MTRKSVPYVVAAVFALVALSLFAQKMNLPKPQIASAVGQPAPDFTLNDQDGKPFHLADMRGSGVVLIFYRGYW